MVHITQPSTCREKEEKRKLEQRIQQMQNQLIPGGASPAAVLQMQKEYESRLADLDRERQSIEEDKQQVLFLLSLLELGFHHQVTG